MVNIAKLLTAFELEAGGALIKELTAGMADGDVTKLLTELFEKEKGKRTAKVKRRPKRPRRPRGYVWMTLHDSRVRPAHRALHGRMFLWSNPPVAGRNGERYHPGRREQCRCFAMRVQGRQEMEKEDWIDEARAALGRALQPEKSDADLADTANVNRRRVFDKLSVPQFGATEAKAVRPVRKVKRVVWGGE